MSILNSLEISEVTFKLGHLSMPEKRKVAFKALPFLSTCPASDDHFFGKSTLEVNGMTTVRAMDLNPVFFHKTKNLIPLDGVAARGQAVFQDDLVRAKDNTAGGFWNVL